MKTNKQDIVYTRTASALEQKLGTRKKFSQVLGELDDTRDDIALLRAYLDDKLENVYSEITRTAAEITQKVVDLDTNVKAELNLKVGVDENDKIVSMINASANVIELKSNRLIVESDNFSISEDGTITATGGTIGDFTIGAGGIFGAFSGLRSTSGIYGTHTFTHANGTIERYTGYLFIEYSKLGVVASVFIGNDAESGLIYGTFLTSGTSVTIGSTMLNN